jgi:hypothetical protein
MLLIFNFNGWPCEHDLAAAAALTLLLLVAAETVAGTSKTPTPATIRHRRTFTPITSSRQSMS